MTVEAIRSGIDLSHVDDQARPQDDLFGHVNGRWLADYAIPADRATDGAFRSLYDRAEEQIRDLIAEAAAAKAEKGTDQQRIGDLFASFTDEATVERIGVAPLLDELATIDDAADADALAAVIGGLQRSGVGGGAGAYIDTDSKDSTRYLLHLSQSGIGLPDESYYRDEQHAEILAAYPRHIAKMFALTYGEETQPGEWQATAERIVALETKLAAAHWDVVKRRDADLTYNLRKLADLPAEAPGFDWAGWVTAMGASQRRPPNSLCANPTTSPRSPHCGQARTSRTGSDGLAGGSSTVAPPCSPTPSSPRTSTSTAAPSAAPSRSGNGGSAASRWWRT